MRFTIIDLETTGLNPQEDEIIEVGLLQFKHNGFTNPVITKSYSGSQQPAKPLTDIVRKITGLTDEALEGESLDWNMISEITNESDLIIAHNAKFDRGFMEASGKWGSQCRWACSMQHINWMAHGFKTSSLNYLACDHGFVNPFAHRALFDCATTFRLITPYLQELYENSAYREVKVSAVGAPFEVKDNLKMNGYRWDNQKRVWFKMLLEPSLEAERNFLATEIYRGAPHHLEEILTDDHGGITG